MMLNKEISSETYPNFSDYNSNEKFYMQLSKAEFQAWARGVLRTQLLIFLPKMSFREIEEITEQMNLKIDDERLFVKIADYMVESDNYCFGNKKLRVLLNEYHNFIDTLLYTYPFLD